MADQQYTHPDVTPKMLLKQLNDDALYQQMTGKPTTPIMIWGQPGIGKSQLIRQVGKNTNRPVIDIRLLLKDPTEIGGLPYFDPVTNDMKYARPSDLPDADGPFKDAIILMDELSSAPMSVQAAALGLVLERRINDYELPKGVMMVAAGNRAGDGTVHNSMPMPLRNRFHHVNLVHNTEDWLEWAMVGGLETEVQSFIKANPDKLNQFDVKQLRGVYTFATPRVWEFVSEEITKFKFLKANGVKMSDGDLYRRVASLVGQDMRNVFKQHFEEAQKLPDPFDVVHGKVKKATIEKTSMKYACSLQIAYALRETITKRFQQSEEGGKEFEEGNDEYNQYIDNALGFMFKNIDEKDINVATFWLLTSKDYGIDVNGASITDELLDDPEFSKFLQAI